MFMFRVLSLKKKKKLGVARVFVARHKHVDLDPEIRDSRKKDKISF